MFCCIFVKRFFLIRLETLEQKLNEVIDGKVKEKNEVIFSCKVED